MFRTLFASFLIAIGVAGPSFAQDKTTAQVTPAVSLAAPVTTGGVQSQNIFEVVPDASADPGYAKQTNAGEAWRQVRNNWIIPYGGALVLITMGAIALFYGRKGTFKQHAPNTGRSIEPFTPFELSAHRANAIAFSILAISDLVIAFGKVEGYLLCESQDAVSASCFKAAKAAGKPTKPAAAMPACADPGAFVYPPVQAAATVTPAPPAAAAPPKKS